MKCLVFLFLSFFTISCRTTTRYVELADQEMFALAREVKKTDNIQLIGYGGGFLDRVNDLFLAFEGSQNLDVDDARYLFFDVANRLLERVNRNEELRPYLANYPFTIQDNIELMFMFPDSKTAITGINNGKITLSRTRDFMFYFGYDPLKGKRDIIYEESYEEALQLYEQQKCNNQPRN